MISMYVLKCWFGKKIVAFLCAYNHLPKGSCRSARAVPWQNGNLYIYVVGLRTLITVDYRQRNLKLHEPKLGV